MFTKREKVILRLGAEAFHTLSHIFLVFFPFPMQLGDFTLTQQFNIYAIIINAGITVALYQWVKKLK